MTLDVETEDEVVIARIVGKLDAIGAPKLQDAIAETLAANPTTMVVDLSGVPYVSSAGLRVLIQIAKQVARGGKIAVSGLNAGVREVFALAGFDRIMTICDDVAAAKAAVAT